MLLHFSLRLLDIASEGLERPSKLLGGEAALSANYFGLGSSTPQEAADTYVCLLGFDLVIIEVAAKCR
jgi:hypothetical protein